MILALAALPFGAVRAGGAEPEIHRTVRLFDWTSGFPWSYASGIEQDRRGFLWIDTTSGLYRFDGARALRMGPNLGVAPGSTASGRVIAYSGLEGTFEATPDGLKRLDPGPRVCEADRLIMAVASDGTPWRVCDGRLARLGAGGAWIETPLPNSPDDPPRIVRAGRDGRVFAAARSSVWLVDARGASRLLTSVDHAFVALERRNGDMIIGANQLPGPVTTRLFQVRDGAAVPIFEERGSRLLSIAERGDTLWVATDRALQALGPGYAVGDRITGPTIPSTGHIVVDREGSLWMSTSRGVVQLPEPDVYAVAPQGGGVTRDIARTSRGVWGTFWGRLAFLADEPGRPRMIDRGEHFSTLCADGAGRVWTAGPHGVTRLETDGRLGPGFGGNWNPAACGSGAAGRRWILSGDRELFTVHPDDEHPQLVSVPVARDDGMSFAAEAADGTLWIATGPRMCAAPAADVAAGREVAWRCEDLPGREVIDFETMPSGDLWAVMWSPQSIIRRSGGRWEVHPGSKTLPVRWINEIQPSPSGGVWLIGQGLAVRVGERTDRAEGWEILEQPTAWNGLVSMNVNDLEEDADGTLWLATDVGILRIPPEIRRRRPEPPPVEMVSGSVNGAPIDAAHPLVVPYGKNRLEAHFAALTYRDPSAVRYRMRLHGGDAWSPSGADGQFNFVDLPPGRYDLEVAGSLDGLAWSASGARLAFRVARPWYANPWLLGGGVVFLALAGHLSYRWKLRQRLARERQRARIAMDLHDEVGSGLGAISVLAGIAARPELAHDRRADTLARIGTVSQDLARSLGDIVWSLRTSSGFLDALWDQLVERARPLFSSGAVRLVLEAPDPVPHEALSLVVRRNLHLVVYEALNNARRHSGASVVGVRLAREGPGWRIEIEDDGRGLPGAEARPGARRGLGLEAMKTRATEMGGTIAWESRPGGGTSVAVRFRTGEG